MGLLTTIEESFNNIWGIQQGRSFITRIFMYWGIITLTPPLVGISISITARLQSSAFAATVLHWLPFGLGSLMLSLFTALTTCLAFTLSYYIIPNVKVRFGAALIGGILAGLLWNITKIVFINFVSTSVKYNAIYGALGILPILMLWIYISWIIVLFGVTYAAANQSMFAGELLSSMRMAPSFRELLAIEVALMSTDALVTGRPPLDVDDFSRQTGVNGSLINNVLEVLVAHGILAKVQRDNEDVGYLPAKDPDDLSFDKIIRVLRQKDGLSFPLKQTIGSDEAISVLMEADQVSMQILARARLRVLAQKGRVTTLPTHQQCSIA
jgi:membrane protein